MHFISQSVLLRALGWSLVDSFWQMALIWLLYSVVTGAGSWYSASVRHRLALISILGGSGWFLFSLVGNIFSESEIQVPVSYGEALVANYRSLSGIIHTANNFIQANLPYLAFAYLITLILMCARFINYYRHSKELRLCGIRKIAPELRIFANEVAQQMGIRRKIQVWLSTVVESPMVVGFFKPVILIPIATVNNLTIQQVESILLHELAHIKRDDYILNLFMTLNGIVFFFNPFVRILINIIKTEREHSCDDVVLQFRYDPCAYASALLSLEKTRNQYHQLVMSAIGRNRQVLLERVRRVTGHKNFCGNYHSRLIGNLILSITTGLVLLLQPQEIESSLTKSAATKINPYSGFESKPIKYLSTALSSKSKKKKPVKSNSNPAATDPDTNVYEYVSNIESDNSDDQDNAVMAVQEETQEYSIAPTVPASNEPPPAVINKYPFVPKSSYCFKVTEDSAHLGKPGMTYTLCLSNESMEKALETWNQGNWKGIEKLFTAKGKKIEKVKLNQEILKAVKVPNWIKIKQEDFNALTEADEVRIKENITLQLRALENRKLRTQFQLNRLKTKIVEDNLKLQLQYLRKQEDNFNKMETRKKVTKIVYI